MTLARNEFSTSLYPTDNPKVDSKIKASINGFWQNRQVYK